MTTYSKEYGYNPPRRKKQRYALIERVIDFSKTPWTSGTDSSNKLETAWADGDKLKAIHIRAGQTVLGVQAEIMEAGTNGKIVKIGDSTYVSRFGAVYFKTKGENQTGIQTSVLSNFGNPVYYSSADDITLTLDGVIAAGKIRFIVHLTEDDR